MNKAESVLVFTGFYLPGFKGGGPIRTISNIVDQLGDDFQFFVIAGDRDLGDLAPYSGIQENEWNEVGRAQVFYLSRGFRGFFQLLGLLRKFDGSFIYLNSFFSFRFSVLPVLLWKLLGRGRKVLLAPRGEFSAGALEIRASKKTIFLAAIRFIRLYKKVIWHASTEYEADEIRRVMCLDADVRNAINISCPPFQIDISAHNKTSPLRMVFVSRISPKKNLLAAIEVLRLVQNHVVFDVYGPMEDVNYWGLCEVALKKLPRNISFNYLGSLSPAQIPGVLVKYDLFYFPTHGENFGHVVAEALGCGLPVLLSDKTPWRNLEFKKLGWDISLEEPALFADRIELCCLKSTEEYSAWRAEIRAWALQNIGNTDSVEKNRQLFLNVSG